MRLARLSICAAVTFAMTGCFLRYTLRQSIDDKLMERAAFEMDCPRDQLEVVPLNHDLDGLAFFGSQVGMKGCGKKGVYVLAEGEGWVLNGSTQDAQAADQK